MVLAEAAAAVAKPMPTNASKARVGAFAEDLASKLGFKPGDALEPLVAQLGGKILYRNPSRLPNGAPESIRVFSSRHFEIYLPSTTSLERDRFTVAHELGHFFLHYPLVMRTRPGVCMVATRWVDETDKVQQRAEWEANWFAAAFLMPEAIFKSEFTRLSGQIPEIASKFGVSSAAVEVRSSSLGLRL